jgi:membrane-bound serine protease (ClpP class)
MDGAAMLQLNSESGFGRAVSAVAAIGLGLVMSLVCEVPLSAQQPLVVKVVLKDTIQPVSEGMLERALAHANDAGATALLVEMDTPGGLVDSMRGMAGAILSSRVPVIIYVAPSGARAGSADSFCWKRRM